MIFRTYPNGKECKGLETADGFQVVFAGWSPYAIPLQLNALLFHGHVNRFVSRLKNKPVVPNMKETDGYWTATNTVGSIKKNRYLISC